MSIENDARGLHQSLWAATAAPAPRCPPLAGDHAADVAIVGGGFTGLSSALHLAERGASVIVLEAHEPGWGASGRNGGQVIAGFKHDLAALEALLGGDVAERLCAFGDGTADATFALIARLGIDCDARQGGWIQGAHTGAALGQMQARITRLSARGVPVELLDRAAMVARLGTDWYRGGCFDPRGGTLQPLSLARGLAHAAAAAGAAVHGDSPVTGLARRNGRWRVETGGGGAVSADRVLLCTNGYSDLYPVRDDIARSVVAFYSYQIATAPLPAAMLDALPAPGLGVSESRRILSYYRVDGEGRFLMGARGALGGSLAGPAFDLARTRLRELYPRLAQVALAFRWNGRVAVSPDYLPRIIEAGPGLHAALGWNGRGVALTTALGPVMADWLTGTAPALLPVPVTPPRPIPLHALKRPASALKTAWMDFLDRRERARG